MPVARHTDPQTSHDAAESVTNLTDLQNVILYLLRSPMADEELVRQVQLVMVASDSGIRTRRSELFQKGLIKPVDYTVTRSKRRAIVWGKA